MPSHSAKRKPAKAARSSKKKGNSIFWSFVAYAAMALIATGLIWVAWPMIFSSKPQPKLDTAHEVQELSAEHPDAEALNPAGSDSKKK